MLAKRLPVFTTYDFAKALETTKIHSVAGKLKVGLMNQRPFRVRIIR
jgi:predicted ATPase with chaperone activity